MKITPLIMRLALIFALTILVAVVIFNGVEGNKLYEEQAYEQLLSFSESKADRVKDFLDNRKIDAVFLAESEDVKNIFDVGLVSDVELMAAKIKNIAEDTRDEIEGYLLEHPDMTVEDLQNDEVFQKIAVRRVGETGYTLVGDSARLVVFFHIQPRFINFDITVIKEIDPDSLSRMEDMQEIGVGYGFYDASELFNITRKKYEYISKTDAVSADGVRFFVSATTYVDEYGGSVQLASRLDKDFRLFQQEKGYEDLIFINADGDVIWTAEQHNELGTNLITGVYNESLLANVFNKAKNDLSVGVSDSEAYGSEAKLNIFITSPVMEIDVLTGERKLKGVLALQLDNEKIEDMIVTDIGLGDAGEVYIINRDRNHITPLKFGMHDHGEGDMCGPISSEGIESCFKDYYNYYSVLQGEDVDEVPKFGKYLNYVDEAVLGAHAYVVDSGWCVITEMSEDEFSEIAPKTNRIMILIVLLALLIILIISLGLDYCFKIKRLRRIR
jgi:hypothetical protein